MRLQRYLAAAGLGSRRHCEEYITAGRVTVDGEVAELGQQVDPQHHQIAFDGEVLQTQRTKYYALNKPVGYICTHRDPGGRPQVTELFPHKGPRLFTVGRLDESSQGLLIVTNDGELAHKLAHPRYRIDRLYNVQVAGNPTREVLQQLEQGLYFEGGKFKCESVRPIKKQGKSTHLELQLREGRNREIRRLLARVGHKVMRLERVGFGPVRLGRLKTGEFRELRPQEVVALQELVQKTASSPPRRSPPRKKSRTRPPRS
jgi:23S rRNA pseudouridine2605 synthase